MSKAYNVSKSLSKIEGQVMQGWAKQAKKYLGLTESQKIAKAFENGKIDKGFNDYAANEYGYTGELEKAYKAGYNAA